MINIDMRLKEILQEAGEPKDSSRRGFLKRAGALGATMMTDPTALVKGVGQAAKSIASPLAKALANPTSLEHRLIMASAAWAAKNVDEVIMKDEFGDVEEGNIWVPGENDVGFSYADNPSHEKPEGINGTMPWGQEYGVYYTPSGLPYLHTTTDGDTDGLLTYMDMNGDIKSRAYYHEDHGMDIDAESNHNIDGDFGGFIDKIEAGQIKPEGDDTTSEIPAADAKNLAGNVVGSMAKRALFTKFGKSIIDKFTKSDTPPAEEPPAELPKADEPLQLPAPTKGEYDNLLDPKIKRMQDLAGIKRKHKD
jgi:hypothetical protein